MGTVATRDFEAWYRGFHRSLEAVVASTFGDDDLARDVSAEAVVRAYERWDRVGAMASPEGWTYRVALNLARRRLRRRALELRILRNDTAAGELTRTQSSPAPGGEMWHLVADLPLRQRQAVVLRHVAGLTEAGIGEVMGIARGTVSATLHTAYKTLRVVLDDDPPGGQPDCRVPGHVPGRVAITGGGLS